MQAHYMSQPKFNRDAESRSAFIAAFPRLEKAYGEAHGGGIRDMYFAKNIMAAAILAGDDDIHIRDPPEAIAKVSPEFEEKIWRCTSLCRPPVPCGSSIGRRAHPWF
jgi:hypothetical protein